MDLNPASSVLTLLTNQPNYLRCQICKKLNFLSLHQSNNQKIGFKIFETCQNNHIKKCPFENYISNKKQINSNLTCDFCGNKINLEKIFYCLGCHKFICIDCRQNHLISTNNHNIISLPKYDKLCMKHFNFGICYDIIASKYCCTECDQIKEKDNIITPVDYSFNEQSINNILKLLNDAKNYLINLKNVKMTIINSLNKLIQNINETFDIFYKNNEEMINLCNILVENYRINKKYNIYEDFFNIKNICNFRPVKNNFSDFQSKNIFSNVNNFLNFLKNQENSILYLSTGIIYFSNNENFNLIKNKFNEFNAFNSNDNNFQEYQVYKKKRKRKIKKVNNKKANIKKSEYKKIYEQYKYKVKSFPPLQTSAKLEFYDLLKTDSGYYYGEWANDLRYGRGLHINYDHSIYLGYFINGQPEGFGKYIGKDRDTIAIWDKNKRIFAKERFSDGISYIGYYNENEFDKYGILTYNNGNCYKGQFKNGLKSGFGISIDFENLNNYRVIEDDNEYQKIYIGNYKKGFKSDFGFIRFNNGDMLAVSFKKENYNGEGIMLCNDGSVYLKDYKKNIEINSFKLNNLDFDDEINRIKEIFGSIFDLINL
jgi:hypothetical protein